MKAKTRRAAFLRIKMFLKAITNPLVPAAHERCELKSACGYLFFFGLNGQILPL